MMSYVDPEGVAVPSGAPRLGADLRAARHRLGWQLADVATGLRIRLPYLEAIEDGRWPELPGNAYALGFVRAYAKMLGLDSEEVARRFRSEAGAVSEKPRLRFPAPVPQRGVPAGAVVLLGILVAAGAYAGWYRYSGSDEARVTQTSSAPPERLAAMVPPPPPQSPQVASILPTAPQGLPSAPALPPPVIPVPVPVAVAIAPPAPTNPVPAVTSRFVLRSKAGGYVQVKERLGKTLLRRAMSPGETWPLPQEADLLLTTGNAANLELLVDGKPGQPLGGAGTVLNDLPLDPVLARAGKANSTGGRQAR